MSKLIRSEEVDGKPDPRVDSDAWNSLAEGLQKSLSFNTNRSFSDDMIVDLNKIGKDIIVLSRKLNTASNALRENAVRILVEKKQEKTPEEMEANRVAFVSMLSQINASIVTLNGYTVQLIDLVNKEVGR